MFWYIVICILMLYPMCIIYAGNFSEKRTQKVALISACFILWFFMAMRSTVIGVDTKFYSYVFTQFADIPLSKVFTAVTYATSESTWVFDFEPGYRLYNKIISYFSSSPQAITIMNSTVIIWLLYKFIYRNSPNFMLSIWLYITLGVYQTEMNVTRNAIAILIVYNAVSYIRKREFSKYLMCCVLASTFHMAAIAFIPVYWLINNTRLTLKKSAIIVVSACVIGIVFPLIGPYIQMITPDSLDQYFVGDSEKFESLLVGILNAGVFFVCYVLMNRKEQEEVFIKCREGMMFLLLNISFFGLYLGLADASRMAALFGPYIIVLIPQMLSLVRNTEWRRILTLLISVMCGVQYIMRLCINNIGGTMPYQFYW